MEGEREGVTLVLKVGDSLGDLVEVTLAVDEKVGDTPEGVELDEILGDLDTDAVRLGETEDEGEREREEAPVDDTDTLGVVVVDLEAFRERVTLGETLGEVLTEGDLLALGHNECLVEGDPPPPVGDPHPGEELTEVRGELELDPCPEGL